MVVVSSRPRQNPKPGSGSSSMICATPAARSRRSSLKGATNEEATTTPVPARSTSRRRLRRVELPAGTISRKGDRPDRLRRRIRTLSSLEHHRRTGIHRHSPQASRDRSVKRFKEGTSLLFESYLWWEPAGFEDVPDGQPYLGVGGRGACGEAYAHGAFGEPAPFFYLFAVVQRGSCRFVADGVTLYAVAARYVVAVRHPLVRDYREVVRVRGVVTPDHDHHVQGMLQKSEEGVLSVLGRRADGVEELEVPLDVLGPVALG